MLVFDFRMFLAFAACIRLVQDKFKPYEVVVPLLIRKFLRETGGEVLIEEAAKQVCMVVSVKALV